MMSLWALVAGSRGEKPMASRLVLRPVLQAVGELYPGVVEGMEQAAVRKADEDAVNRRRLLAPSSRGITDLLALLVGTAVRPVVVYPHPLQARAAIAAEILRIGHVPSLLSSVSFSTTAQRKRDQSLAPQRSERERMERLYRTCESESTIAQITGGSSGVE